MVVGIVYMGEKMKKTFVLDTNVLLHNSNCNGLSYAVERLKPLPLHGHVTLTKSERSTLAAAAADLL